MLSHIKITDIRFDLSKNYTRYFEGMLILHFAILHMSKGSSKKDLNLCSLTLTRSIVQGSSSKICVSELDQCQHVADNACQTCQQKKCIQGYPELVPVNVMKSLEQTHMAGIYQVGYFLLIRVTFFKL